MIAGLLNLLLVHDALGGVPGGLMRRREEKKRRERHDALRAELAELAAMRQSGATGEAQPDATPTDQEPGKEFE